MENVKILEHPLLQHKISRLRDETTGTNEFRALVEEIAMLMGYEALNDLPIENVEVKTPIETCKTPMLSATLDFPSFSPAPVSSSTFLPSRRMRCSNAAQRS